MSDAPNKDVGYADAITWLLLIAIATIVMMLASVTVEPVP